MRWQLLLCVFLIASGRGAKAQGYQTSGLSPIESTFSYITLNGPKGKKYYAGENLGLSLPESYHGENRYRFRLYKHKRPAPLVFLNVGLGGKPNSRASRYLANLMYGWGYHVVVLGSTFSDEFAALAAESAYVGQASVDAHSLYTKLVSLKSGLLGQGLQVTQWGLAGFSFGALVSGHMARLDKRWGHFNFSKVVLINPPVDLLKGLRKLDEFYGVFAKNSMAHKVKIISRLNTYYGLMQQAKFDPLVHAKALKQSGLTQSDISGLVGRLFRGALGDVVFFSQEIHDLGVLPKHPVQRRKASKRMGFEEYVGQLISRYLRNTPEGIKLWRRFYGSGGFSMDKLNSLNGAHGLASIFRNDHRITVLHNADDFLIDRADIRFLRENLGSRLILFPEGGHLGNLWNPSFQQRLAEQWRLAFQ